jgi:hypothetical protein
MTLDEARWMARRFAAITGQPMVVCRSGLAEWDVWRSLNAARWLADDGELVLPRVVRDPDEVERRLRFEAARLQGRARLTLLEAALAVRCRKWQRSAPARLTPPMDEG